ncbi:MAG TPA: 50S ribosomal protein L29 [Myxococcota bacterium]|nr:50S ribosomal protein L29 [Myxococcota bacterium]
MSDFNDLDDKGLVEKLVRSQHQLLTAKFALGMGRLQNTSSVRKLRKDIARMRTELRRREVASGVAKDSLAQKFGGNVSREAAVPESAGFLAGMVDKLGDSE